MAGKRLPRKERDEDSATKPRVPVDAPPWVSAELIALTIRTWQPYYASTLTPQDAAYIIMSVGRLFDALSRGDVE